jgi:hypothetical protein
MTSDQTAPLVWADEYLRRYGEPAPALDGYEAVVFNRRMREEMQKAAPDGRVTVAMLAECARKAAGKPA